jgi:hypothetical protein
LTPEIFPSDCAGIVRGFKKQALQGFVKFAFNPKKVPENPTFVFTGVVPGAYKLFAFDGLVRSAFYYWEVLAQFEERGESIRLAESADEPLT